MGRELLLVTRPPKKWSTMTAEEKRAWATQVVEAMRRRIGDDE
jgi:hypothetical protein